MENEEDSRMNWRDFFSREKASNLPEETLKSLCSLANTPLIQYQRNMYSKCHAKQTFSRGTQ
jgi:hypothetical protein